MKLFRTLLATSLLFLISWNVSAQTDTLSIIKKWLPNINGVIRAKFEINTNNGESRFDVRNARFGMFNNVGKYFGYKFEIDFSDEGKIKMLDAFVNFIPHKNITVSLGQMKAPFSSEYLLNPGKYAFSNRPFIDKRICKDLRDIGLKVTYELQGKVPFSISAVLMNGTGLNNPEWTTKLAGGSRILIGPFKGFSIQGNYFSGFIGNYKTEMQDYGVRYEYKNFVINTEYAQKTVVDTSSAYTQSSLFAYVLYNIYIKKGMIKYITPAARYEFFSSNLKSGIVEPHRITAGLTFGFHKLTFACIRLDYEKYLYRNGNSKDDKFTIEFIARF